MAAISSNSVKKSDVLRHLLSMFNPFKFNIVTAELDINLIGAVNTKLVCCNCEVLKGTLLSHFYCVEQRVVSVMSFKVNPEA